MSRLHSVTVTCVQRGLYDAETARLFAAILAQWHGWTTAVSAVEPCGCVHLYRDQAALDAACQRHGWASVTPKSKRRTAAMLH